MSSDIYQAAWDRRFTADQDMFDNDLFSDAKVTAGDKTWSVHKVILCRRSEHFNKALNGHFKEIDDAHVNIEGLTSNAVGAVLYYLYTGVVPTNDFEDIREAVDFFVAADYFDIQELRQSAVNTLGLRLDDLEETGNNQALLDDLDIEQFFYAAHSAYASGHEALREPIENFLAATDFLLMKDDRFMKELSNHAEFAMAIIRLMASPRNEFRMATCCKTEPQVCWSCKIARSDFAETLLFANPEQYPDECRMLVGTCEECYATQIH
ncbi:BTB/POZ protein [Apiospora arundinis]|uniref:BTB/POZ protein n=1 Tax=Apiospora arundinis TaxID=335852 RepID=A0ABR2JID9_9PEZI